MADDALEAFVRSTGIRDTEALRFVIIDAIDRIRTRERTEDAKAVRLASLSRQYLDDWIFDTITVAGRFPPPDDVRTYDGLIESSGAVISKYATRPHVRVIIEGPRGTQFKMGIVLMCKQHPTQHEIRFSSFEVHVAVDAIPASLGTEVQVELTRAVFKMLRKEHSKFIHKMKRYCSDIEQAVIRQITG